MRGDEEECWWSGEEGSSSCTVDGSEACSFADALINCEDSTPVLPAELCDWEANEMVAEDSYRQPRVHDLIMRIFTALRGQEQSVVLQLQSGPERIPVLEIQPTYDEMCRDFHSDQTQLPLHKALFIVRASKQVKSSMNTKDPRASYGSKTAKCSNFDMLRIGGDWKNWKRATGPPILKPWKFTCDRFPGVSVCLVVPRKTVPAPTSPASAQESVTQSSGKRKAEAETLSLHTPADDDVVGGLSPAAVKKDLIEQLQNEDSEEVIMLVRDMYTKIRRLSERKATDSKEQDFRLLECLISSVASSLGNLDLDCSREQLTLRCEHCGPLKLALTHSGDEPSATKACQHRGGAASAAAKEGCRGPIRE